MGVNKYVEDAAEVPGPAARGPGVGARTARAPGRLQGQPRQELRGPARLEELREAARGSENLLPGDPPGAEGPLLDGRGVRSDAGRLRQVHADVLSRATRPRDPVRTCATRNGRRLAFFCSHLDRQGFKGRGLLIPAFAYDLPLHFVLALHIVAVVIAFGWTFALPIYFVVAAKRDPRSLPLLHRIEYTISRVHAQPRARGGAGRRYLLGERRSPLEGVLRAVGPRRDRRDRWSGRGGPDACCQTAPRRPPRATSRASAAASFSRRADYQAATRRLNIVGSSASLLVLITIVIMAVKP